MGLLRARVGKRESGRARGKRDRIALERFRSRGETERAGKKVKKEREKERDGGRKRGKQVRLRWGDYVQV